MSRSYKKYPRITDHGKSTYKDKRNASKSVRHTEDVPDGGSFKHCFCSYDISDYNWGEWSWEEVWNEINLWEDERIHFYEQILGKPYNKKKKTEKDLLREWHKRIGK
jgi:hypothetical protein